MGKKKKRYEYTGPSYRQLSLEPGDIREIKPKFMDDGSVEVKVWGSDDMRKLNLYYRNVESFNAKWKEVE